MKSGDLKNGWEEEKIIEGNKLIAEFVGAKIITEYEDHSLFDYGVLLFY